MVQMQDILDRLDRMDAKMAAGFARLDAKMDADVARLDAKMDAGFARLDAKMDAGFARLDAKMDAGFQKQGAQLEELQDGLKLALEGIAGNRQILDDKFAEVLQKLDERVQPIELASRHFAERLSAATPRTRAKPKKQA